MIVDITETLSLNTNQIDVILYPVYNARISKSSHAFDTIQSKVDLAQKQNRFFDFTNKRDGIKSLIVLSDGTVIGTSLTRDVIAFKLENKRKHKIANK